MKWYADMSKFYWPHQFVHSKKKKKPHQLFKILVFCLPFFCFYFCYNFLTKVSSLSYQFYFFCSYSFLSNSLFFLAISSYRNSDQVQQGYIKQESQSHTECCTGLTSGTIYFDIGQYQCTVIIYMCVYYNKYKSLP